ncbi:hypothetical protein HUU05_12620 [candidate division KSB1 bacterium]|nr:hypothetical protein [candidate division KSB1 bacterium]
MKRDDRKTIRGKGWKRTTSIALDKYTAISSAILEVLTTEPMSFSDVVRGVKRRVKSFSGSIAWYTITCLRELESQKKIIRHKTKPVGYTKKNS